MTPSLLLSFILLFSSPPYDCDLKNAFTANHISGKHSDRWKFFTWKDGRSSLLYYGEGDLSRRDDAEIVFDSFEPDTLQMDTFGLARRFVEYQAQQTKASFPGHKIETAISAETEQTIGRHYWHVVKVLVTGENKGAKREMHRTHYFHYGPRRVTIISTVFQYPELPQFERDFRCVLESVRVR
jgi:hypothetical protein